MLTCRANTLQTMPYAMAAGAVGSPLYLSETRSTRTQDPLPCITVDGAEDEEEEDEEPGGAGGHVSCRVYCDYGAARVMLPRELVPAGRRRVHLLTAYSDSMVEESFRDGFGARAASRPFVSFVPSRDCR